MLGYQTPLTRYFDASLTIASLIVAIGMISSAFLIAGVARKSYFVEVGGAVLGLGIAAMHYTGMAAYQASAVFLWDTPMVVASIVLGAAFGALALNRIARPSSRFSPYAASAALVLGICSLHFTGMAALIVVPTFEGADVATQALPDSIMVAGVVVVTLLIMATSGSAYMIDRYAAAEASEKYKHLAMHDALTGLPNRAHLAERLHETLARGASASAEVAILAIDLDRFKDINDAHGHAAGDALLRALSMRISSGLAADEYIARVGGDEFVAIKSGVFSRNDALAFAERLRQMIFAPCDWNGQRLSVGCSVGIATFPDDGTNPTDLLTHSDLAMYRAKARGRDQICLYDESLDENGKLRAQLAIDLKIALEQGQFEMHYQPQNDAFTRELVGFEALIRWNHPVLGRVSPTEFIPVAEQAGLIVDIGNWVLKTACATAASWSSPYRVAVNVASVQLARSDFPETVSRVLEQTGLEPHRLEIEITESGIISDQQHALKTILALKAIGVTIAMDDFGTGYSSLATLQNFPFDKIKIDRSFISNVGNNAHSEAIVRATILLADSLRVPVLAEGVETESHLAFLQRFGCQSVQGYLFGKPVPATDVATMIAVGQLNGIVDAGKRTAEIERELRKAI